MNVYVLALCLLTFFNSSAVKNSAIRTFRSDFSLVEDRVQRSDCAVMSSWPIRVHADAY